MEINDLQIGNVVLTGLCYGYTNVKNNEICELPLMITEVKDIDKNQALCKVIDMPETYVDINDILGIPLNQYRLRLLGFKQIDKIHALRPGAPNFNGTVYEAQINGIKIQIIEDNNSYELCRSTSAPTLPINYVHDMQHNITVNGKPLKINYMIFCPDRK